VEGNTIEVIRTANVNEEKLLQYNKNVNMFYRVTFIYTFPKDCVYSFLQCFRFEPKLLDLIFKLSLESILVFVKIAIW